MHGMPWCAALLLALLPWATQGREAALSNCRLPGVAQSMQCGTLLRPLDASRPNGPAIEVAYAVSPALARDKHPDPVLLLAGGPGQSAIAVAPSVLPLLARLNQRRDIVFIDQRGTGRSAKLDCELPDSAPLSAPLAPLRRGEWLAACRARLAALPQVGSIDGLRHFTTTPAMNDVDAVRRALGVAQWNLIGVSYGTRAALELMRLHPQTVRRAVLDGVAPPDMALPASSVLDSRAVLDAVFDQCRSDPACVARHPDLRHDWNRLLAGLPRTIELRDPHDGSLRTIELTRQELLAALRAPLYLPSISSALPAAIAAAAGGRFEPLAALATMTAPHPGRKARDGVAVGLHFSVICSEDVSARPDPPPAGADVDEVRALYVEVCADWPRARIDPAFYRVGRSAAPLLLLSGGLDPVTPPRHAARVAALLGPLAVHRIVPNAGHGVWPVGCMRDVVTRFIDAPDAARALDVDSRCAESIPRPTPLLPVLPSAAR